MSDVVGSLGSESSGLDIVGKSGDLTWSLDENLEGNDRKVGSTDAASDGLSLSLSSSSGSVEGSSY